MIKIKVVGPGIDGNFENNTQTYIGRMWSHRIASRVNEEKDGRLNALALDPHALIWDYHVDQGWVINQRMEFRRGAILQQREQWQSSASCPIGREDEQLGLGVRSARCLLCPPSLGFRPISKIAHLSAESRLTGNTRRHRLSHFTANVVASLFQSAPLPPSFHSWLLLSSQVFHRRLPIKLRWDAFLLGVISCLASKVNIFVWRLDLNRLPTRDNIDKRRIDIESLFCHVCGTGADDASQMFFQYSLVG
ncbi:hypothetical protein LXL04_022946 [Taraxacum kok-saghyz]